jgi:hypothetical protein
MVERQRYEVVQRCPGFEVRRYAAHLVAQVEVDGSFSDAANRAFGDLAAFISGRNSTRAKVAMTAPVVQEEASARIAMTAPVVQEPGEGPGRYLVSFVMPAGFTTDTLPVPADPRVRIREVPAELGAARTFTGRWSEALYQEQLAALRTAVQQAGMEPGGAPKFARFDPPWTPWFLRRNEVVLPIADQPAPTTPPQ